MDIKRNYPIENTLTAQKVCQLINDGKVNDLPLLLANDNIYSTTFSIGSIILPLASTKAQYISSVALDSSRVLVCYSDSSNHLCAVVLTIDATNGTIAAGQSYQLNNVSTSYISCVALSSGQVVVSYSMPALCAIVLTINGTTISSGTAYTLNSTSYSSTWISAVALDSTRVLVTYTYNNGTYYLYSVVLTISGNLITPGTFTLITNVQATQISSILVNPSTALITYTGASGYLWSALLTINGTEIGGITLVQINSISTNYQDLCILDSTHILLCYEGTSYYCYATILTLVGTTIAVGTPTQINSVVSSWITTIALSPNSILLIYQNGTVASSSYMWAVILTITNDVISIGPLTQINSSSATIYISAEILDSTHVLVNYENSTTTYLESVIITIPIATSSSSISGKPLGIAQDSIGSILLKGISRGHNNLVAGANYYYDSNGVISTNKTGTFLGIALSPTDIYIADYIID